MTPARKLTATPTPYGETPLYAMPDEDSSQTYGIPVATPGDLPEIKPEDQQYFSKLLEVCGCVGWGIMDVCWWWWWWCGQW